MRQHFQGCNTVFPGRPDFSIAPWHFFLPGQKILSKFHSKWQWRYSNSSQYQGFWKWHKANYILQVCPPCFFLLFLHLGKNACFHLCLSLIFSFCTISSGVPSVWTIMPNLYLLSTTSLSLHTQWWPYLTSAKSRYGCCPSCILPS